jgi:hypothetical protein
VCTKPIDLFASQAGERGKVGHVAAGGIVGVLADGDPFLTVRVMSSGVFPFEGGSIAVRKADVAACAPVTGP